MNDRPDQPSRRAGRYELAGRRRALAIAVRLGMSVRHARQAANLTQAQVAARAGVTQTSISLLERGRGTGTGLETWAAVAAALGDQLAAFLEHASGAEQPRDIEHIRRQSGLITTAAPGGWRGLPEFAVDPGSPRSRSIDVALIRPATGRRSLPRSGTGSTTSGQACAASTARLRRCDFDSYTNRKRSRNSGSSVRCTSFAVRSAIMNCSTSLDPSSGHAFPATHGPGCAR